MTDTATHVTDPLKPLTTDQLFDRLVAAAREEHRVTEGSLIGELSTRFPALGYELRRVHRVLGPAEAYEALRPVETDFE